MKNILSSALLQLFLLVFLLAKDKNDGEKELFRRQQWKPFDVLIIVVVGLNFFPILNSYLIDSFLFKNMVKNFCIPTLMQLIFLIIYFKFKLKQSIGILGFKMNRNYARM